jgi:hypothetical protein
MSGLVFLLVFLGGLILLFSIGWFIGYLLKLDKTDEEMEQKRAERFQNK